MVQIGDAGEVGATGAVLTTDLLRGNTDTIVLAVLRQGDSYGFDIYKQIRDATAGRHEIKEATLYATYRRLMADGLVEAYWGDETQGGRRKYYRITDAGRAVYERNVLAWTATRDVIDTLLGLAPSTARRGGGNGRRPS